MTTRFRILMLAGLLLFAAPLFADGEREPIYLFPIQYADEYVSERERANIHDVVVEEMGALFWLQPFGVDRAEAIVGAAGAKTLAACKTARCATPVLKAAKVSRMLMISVTRLQRKVFQVEAALLDVHGKPLMQQRYVERGGQGELKYGMTGVIEQLFAAEMAKKAKHVTTIVETTAVTTTEADAALDRADLLAAQGDYEDALKLYEETAGQSPTLALPYIRMAHLYIELQRYDDAMAAAKKAIKRDKADAQAQLALAEAAMSADRKKVAEVALKAVLALEPKHAKAAFLLGTLLADGGKLAAAVKAFETALASSPDAAAAARVNLGILYVKLNKPQKALAHLTAALEQDPALLAAYPPLADLYEQQKNWQKALEIYLKLGEMTEACAACAFNAGRMYDELGRPDEAIAQYENTIELDADFIDAYYSLGRLLIDAEDCPAAIRMLDHYIANETRPDQKAFVVRAKKLKSRCSE